MGVGGEGFEGHSTGFEITVLSWNLSRLESLSLAYCSQDLTWDNRWDEWVLRYVSTRCGAPQESFIKDLETNCTQLFIAWWIFHILPGYFIYSEYTASSIHQYSSRFVVCLLVLDRGK